MDANDNFEIIRDIYESCNGDLDKTKKIYKSMFGRHVTDRHIMKALSSSKMEESDAVLEEEEVVYVDCIQNKDESDEDVIFCCEDPIAEETHKEQKMLDEKLGYYPIVYTTRLEDMHIFKKNLENIPFNSVIHKVVAESKPEFISDTFTKETLANKSISFDELVCKLKQLNTLASSCTLHNTKETHIKTEPKNIVSNLASTDMFQNSKEVHTITELVVDSRCDLDSIETIENNSELDIKTELIDIVNNLANADTFHMSKEVHTVNEQVVDSRCDLDSIEMFRNNSELDIKTEPKDIVSNLASTDTFHKSKELHTITKQVVDSPFDLDYYLKDVLETFQNNSELDIKTAPIDIVSNLASTNTFQKSKEVHTITEQVVDSQFDLDSIETFQNNSELDIKTEPIDIVSNLASTDTFHKSKELHTITEQVVDSRCDLDSIETFQNKSELDIKTEPIDIGNNLANVDTFHKSKEVHTINEQVVDSRCDLDSIEMFRNNSKLDIKTEPIDIVSNLPGTDTIDTFYKSKKVQTITEPVIDSLSDLASTGKFHNSALYMNTEPDDSLSEPLRKKKQELCKPLSIILVNCKSQLEVRKCVRHKKRTFDDNLMQCDECIKYKMCRLGDVAKHKSMAKHDQPNNIYFIQRILKVPDKKVNLWVVMKNSYLNTTEIFHLRYDLGIPTDFYYIDHVIDEDNELAFYINYFNNILEFHNCCWIKRHENIKSVYFAQMAPYLWMHAHPCSYNKCTCCCRNKISIEARYLSSNCESESDVTLNQIKETKTSRSSWQQLLSAAKCTNRSRWINKALDYREKSKSKIVVSVQSLSNLYYCYSIRIRIGTQTKFCLVRSDGEVQYYIKLPRPQKLFGPYEEHIKSSYEIIKSFNTQCCCWMKYTKFLTTLMATVPDAVNFLKLPHPCPLGACKCCCKSKKDGIPPFSFKRIELPHTLSHTKKSTMKYKRNMEDVYNKLKTCSSKKCLSISKPIKNISKQTKINRPTNTEVVPVSLTQTVESDINRPLTNISANATIPDARLTVPETQDPTVNTLIATILDRFKNIRLKLNPGGQVVAELETSATELSSEELQILYKILAHAQQQVNTLGITYNPNNILMNPLNVAIDPVLSNSKQVSVEVTKDTAENPQVPTCWNTNDSIDVSTTSIPPVVMLDGTNQNNVVQNKVSITNELQEAKQHLQETVDRCTDVFDAYTKLSYLKNKQYQQSFEAYSKFNKKSTFPQLNDANSNQKLTFPQIKNTYSLNALIKPMDVVNETSKSSKTQQTQKPSILRKRKSRPETILESVLSSKKPKQATDIKIKNVQSQSSNESSVQQSPQVPTFTAMGQGIPPLILCNFPYEAPMLVNPVNNQNMPHQGLPMNGAFIQPFIVPHNLINGVVPMPVNNSFLKLPSNPDPIDLTNFEPDFPDNDAADDCILGV